MTDEFWSCAVRIQVSGIKNATNYIIIRKVKRTFLNGITKLAQLTHKFRLAYVNEL